MGLSPWIAWAAIAAMFGVIATAAYRTPPEPPPPPSPVVVHKTCNRLTNGGAFVPCSEPMAWIVQFQAV